MTIKLNKFVIFMNKIRPDKRFVNQHISRIASYGEGIPIYQKTLKNGSTALSATITNSHGTKYDEFVVVNKDGTYFERGRKYTKEASKTFFTKLTNFCDKNGWRISAKFQNKFFRNNKLEESAMKEITKDNRVNIIVRSVAGRQSQFPKTPIGRNLYPAVCAKAVEANGDIVYRESFLTR